MDKFNDACLMSCEDWVSRFSDTAEFEFSQSFERQMNILVDKMRNNKYHRLTGRSMRALIIAAIILSFATTVFAVPSSRKYIIKQFKDHFSYTVADVDIVNKVDGLTVGYIPDGLRKADEYIYEKEILQEYISENGWVNIDKCSIDISVNIDVSDKELKIIDGIEYLFFTTDNTNGVIWNNGFYTYTVSGNISREEIEKIALNIE